MLLHLFRMFREFPVTWLILFVCPILWALDLTVSNTLEIPYYAAAELLGGASDFGLWSEQWWRIFTSALHHADFVHLLMNLAAIGIFGRLLEVRWGSPNYAIFCLAALAVSGISQSLVAEANGLSGLLFAQFGLIWIWRKTDEWWQAHVPDQFIQIAFFWFFICFPLDWLGILPIANVAHATGLIYGYLIGKTHFSSPRLRQWRPVVMTCHVFLIPAMYLAMHPLWNGIYHCWLGDQAKHPLDRIRHYENAVHCDADLEGAWRLLALLHLEEGDLPMSWKCILECLKRHPTSDKGIQVARKIAGFMGDRRVRRWARQQLAETFHENLESWEHLLFGEMTLEDLPALVISPDQSGNRAKRQSDVEIQAPDLPPFPTILPKRALDEIPRDPAKLPPPDPDAPGSAEEGRAA